MSDYRPGFLGVDDYLKLEREKDAWLLKPLLPVGGAALIYGDAKTGKSYIAIQLALALSGQAPDWLGFPVHNPGKVLYLQLDTPRSVWGLRFEELIKGGNLKYDSSKLLLADRDSIEFYPFDILQPAHCDYMKGLIVKHNPVAVIYDTLRESHSGDEDKSTVGRNVIANLVDASGSAAMIIISHSRKPSPDQDKDLLADNRGSSYVVGRMDAIMRLTKTRLFYTGRSIEAGDVRLERTDNGLWAPKQDDQDLIAKVLIKIMGDKSLLTNRDRARKAAPLLGKSEESVMSILRRLEGQEVVNRETGEILEVSLNNLNGG